jgi:hypothetical protein
MHIPTLSPATKAGWPREEFVCHDECIGIANNMQSGKPAGGKKKLRRKLKYTKSLLSGPCQGLEIIHLLASFSFLDQMSSVSP